MTKLTDILYVEDDADISMITTIVLTSAGYEVRRCATAMEALDALNEYTPQLILSDVMMPQMDGVELFKEVQQQHKDKCLPVIFMTAKAQVHEQEEYLALGVLGVIVKPYDPTTLCSEIEQLWALHNHSN